MSSTSQPQSSEDFDLSLLGTIPDPLRPSLASGAAPAATEQASATITTSAAVAGPTRTALHRRRLFAIIASLVWLFGVQLIIGVRTDLSLQVRLAHVGVPMLLGAIAMWLAFGKGPLGLGPTWRNVAVFGAFAPLAFIAAAFTSPCVESGSTLFEGMFFCGDFIMAIAIVPLLALTWAQRRSFAASAGVRSALVGVAVGFTASGIQALHCAHSDGYHVLVGHSWPVLAMGALGLFALQRTLRV